LHMSSLAYFDGDRKEKVSKRLNSSYSRRAAPSVTILWLPPS
jgi:hypothetical protein